MANEIRLKIKVDDDGSLSIVGKEAKTASEELDKVGKAGGRMGKSARDADRNMKGLSKQSANANKNFSKMQQGMTGGLVPAYAILASNVFALSAAFEFFKRAADLKNLEASQISYAENTGVALGSITARLREASGGMLGFKEAAQAAAIGMAKGFSPSQLEELAEGARKASVALGRNFEDSFDRLIRGASKAEPELLDELGITLRLEDATKKYAESIGKSAKELNTYQRSQAVLIETQRQLQKNFGGMDASVNPFVRLSKVFDDIIKAGTGFFLPMVEGIATLLATSATAAIAAFGLLGMSILKTILPMDQLGEKLENFQRDTKQGWDDAVQGVKDYQLEIQKASANVAATKAGGEEDMQKFAQEALDQGADSPILKRAAKGEMRGSDEAMMRKGLDSYTKQMQDSGKVTRGMFAKVNSDLVNSTEGALNRMQAKHANVFQRMGKRVVLWGKRTKLVFKGVGVIGRTMFLGLAKGARMAGKVMDKAMKMAGIVGIIKLIWDMGQRLLESPMTIALGFARMADNIVNFTAPLLDWIIKGFLSMSDSVLNTWNNIKAGVTNIITSIRKVFAEKMIAAINSAKEAANGLIETFNTVTGASLGTFDLQDPPDPDDYKQVTAEVSNLAGAYVKINDEGTRFEKILTESSLGKRAAAHEAEQDAIKASANALREFIDAAKASEKSLGGVALGMEQAVSEGINPSTKAFNGLISLDVAGLFKKLGAETKVWNTETKKFDTKSVLNEVDRARAVDELSKRMGGLTKLSPKYAAALKKALAGDDSDLLALAKDLSDTNVQLKFFEEGLTSTKTSVKDALGGGDMRSAITALRQLRDAGEDAGEGVEDATGRAGKLAELQEKFKELFGEGTDANVLLSAMEAIQMEQDALAASTAELNGITGISKTLLEEDLNIRVKINEIAQATLELANAANETDKAKIQQKLRILEIEKAITEQARMRRLSEEMRGAGKFGATAAGGLQHLINVEQTTKKKAGLQSEWSGLQGMAEHGVAMTEAEEARLKAMPGLVENVNKELSTLSEGNAKNVFKNMAADFAALGPEGELMSQVSMGMGTMITAVQLMGEAGDNSAKRMAAGFQVAGAVLSSVSGIMNAAHQNRMRGIDAEIKAEKKRDGKSKESLARIKALEKKKEGMARKNFEMNKKMQMANVIISTAAAVASVWANPVDWFKIGAGMLTPIVLAMGAAQLAMIAGTSFQGGGNMGGAGTSMPTSIAVGERKNTVDMAKSKSARGELAYLRGGQGIGGPENFRSAFYGVRHRAAGGSAGYVVGEQGPELFMPDRPGTIVSADETDDIGGGAGVVTFNINAVDSAGVEEVLTQQQGHIISMLRTAANVHGEEFFEMVDDTVYTPHQGSIARL